MTSAPILLPAGDQALVVQLSEDIDAAVNARVIALADALDRAGIAGITDRVPTYRSLLVRYDPTVIRGRRLEERLLRLLEELDVENAPARLWRVPVLYGGPAGLDLEDLAREKKMSPEELVALHCGTEYRVFMIGFAPGFAYLGGLNPRLHTPRLAIPRQMIPAGAVGMGGQQASINSVAGPSGWRFIGGTPVRLFDPARDPAILLAAGDRIMFEPVDRGTFTRLAALAAAGRPVIGPEVA
ncbi:5-oxoprolinase subunit PxpB [Falsirhodobacter sp. 20TX0035]|uniref:5-oxoprolinase subunit PxpB n=1 Tax=Falsirhodobacter sp. 20TX0035 TaxID=3022019 RepID=UPI00232E90C6|nr:5-oxoprolinase subunit PxpB [Falsirhodobacter sp. 20TX0035]MDB6454215.1 5-oxoprolinase subunit PxpB [Falsirhodobacter sp. 20TX0035]